MGTGRLSDAQFAAGVKRKRPGARTPVGDRSHTGTERTNSLRFEYDQAGRLSKRTDQRGVVVDYAYDQRGLLTGKDISSESFDDIYTYDGGAAKRTGRTAMATVLLDRSRQSNSVRFSPRPAGSHRGEGVFVDAGSA